MCRRISGGDHVCPDRFYVSEIPASETYLLTDVSWTVLLYLLTGAGICGPSPENDHLGACAPANETGAADGVDWIFLDYRLVAGGTSSHCGGTFQSHAPLLLSSPRSGTLSSDLHRHGSRSDPEVPSPP